jgi:cell division septum initiation protein DivIVA
MALEPKAIDLGGLPRTIGGGLKREPVEDLLNRVQREYSQLYYEQKRLKEELERRDRETAPSGQAPAAPQAELAPLRMELERRDVELASLRQELRGREAELDELRQQAAADTAERAAAESAAAHESPAMPKQPGSASHREVDELARIVLAAAHRASNEIRESARSECELMLKKARERVFALEFDFERTRELRTREIAELESLLAEIRVQLQATLESLAPSELPAVGDGRVEKTGDHDGQSETAGKGLTVVPPSPRSETAPPPPGATAGKPGAKGRTDLEAAS